MMSDATMTYRSLGTIHPSVERAARAMHAQDWRVTSILRAGSANHSRGVALDTAPMRASIGRFGFATAWTVWDYLTRTAPPPPPYHWAVISEADHTHVQLATRPAIGANIAGATYLYAAPATRPPPGLAANGLKPLPFAIIC